MKQIAESLQADGVLTGGKKTNWHSSRIALILKNEKYMGDALLQKTYTIDFLTKKRVKNNGIMPQYYVENDHPAIIPKSVFMQVQNLIRRRHKALLLRMANTGELTASIVFRNGSIAANAVTSFNEICGITPLRLPFGAVPAALNAVRKAGAA